VEQPIIRHRAALFFTRRIMQTISISEAARRTGYSRTTVKKWLAAGLLNSRIEPLSGHWRICPDELRRFVESWEVPKLQNVQESQDVKTAY
jgi:excisionase family DNA binding protein